MATVKETTTLKKAYCTHCKTENELNRIFEVNPDAELCYCPFCMRKLKPKEAIEDYNFFLSQKILKANRLLYRDTKFTEAYAYFAHVIEIDPKCIDARFGRLISLIYMSTLRKTYFKDVISLLDIESSNYFRKMKNQERFEKILQKMNAAVDEYCDRFYKRLMFKDRFYNVGCAELYFKRIYEITEIKKAFVEEIDRIRQKVQSEKIEEFYNNLLEDIKDKENIFAERVITLDGGRYKPLRFNDVGQLILTKSEDYAPAINLTNPRKLYDTDAGDGSLIKDKVFPDNSYITKVIKMTLPLMFAFLAGAVTCLSLFFFGMKKYRLYMLIGASVGFAVAAFFLALFIIWKRKLIKRRHLID